MKKPLTTAFLFSSLPIVLAHIGFIMTIIGISSPLLVWNIHIVLNSQNNPIPHSPWGISWGKSLDNFLSDFRIPSSEGNSGCWARVGSSNFELTIERSDQDKKLENFSLVTSKLILPLFLIGLVEILVAIFCFWALAIKYRLLGEALAITIGCESIFIVLFALLGPVIDLGGSGYSGTMPAICQGKLALAATLEYINFGVPIFIIAGLAIEISAFSIMVYQIFKLTTRRS